MNQSEAENLCEPKSNEAKESEIKRCAIRFYTLLQALQVVSLDSLSVCFLFIELFQRKANPVKSRIAKATKTKIKYGSAPETVTCLTGPPVQVLFKLDFVLYFSVFSSVPE